MNSDDLIRTIKTVTCGRLDKESENLISRMQRKLPPGDDPLRLFALNVDVEKCNSEHLLQMPGIYLFMIMSMLLLMQT